MLQSFYRVCEHFGDTRHYRVNLHDTSNCQSLKIMFWKINGQSRKLMTFMIWFYLILKSHRLFLFNLEIPHIIHNFINWLLYLTHIYLHFRLKFCNVGSRHKKGLVELNYHYYELYTILTRELNYEVAKKHKFLKIGFQKATLQEHILLKIPTWNYCNHHGEF